MDEEVVSYFRVLRSRAGELAEALRNTPFSRAEFECAWQPATEPVERARRLVVRSFMGFSTNGATGKGRSSTRTGFRASAHRQCKTPAHAWTTYPDALEAIAERLRGVVIEKRAACEIIEQQDRSHTLFYVDPPYLPSTRGKWGKKAYTHEMSADDHEALAEQLREVSGMVVLSGYPSDLYEDLYSDWTRIDRHAYADGGHKRTECLWLNDAVQSRPESPTLFNAEKKASLAANGRASG